MHVKLKTLVLGNYQAQMARNLEERLVLEMLHNEKITAKEVKKRNHHDLTGKIRKQQDTKLLPFEDVLREWVERQWLQNVQEDADCYFDVYTGLICRYYDINDPDIELECRARANSKWKHSEKKGGIHDFIIISNGSNQEGIAGIFMGQLKLLLGATCSNGEMRKIAIISPMEQVNVDSLLPIFEYTGETIVIDATSIVRTAHMVPHWSTRIIDLAAEVDEIERDIMDLHTQYVFNTHSDNAAWNYYY
jgi:hypothetical protein